MPGRKRQNSRPEPVPAAPPTGAAQPETQPEPPQLASPLETATANARAFEILVGKLEQKLHAARVDLLKWQGAAEFQAHLEHPAGPGNGKDAVDPLTPGAGDKETGS